VALQGTLDSFSLPDVLRLLAATGQTGRLHVDGDRGKAEVWLQGGALTTASADGALGDAPVDEVVFEMLRFTSGSFAFSAGEQAPDGEEEIDVDGVLRRAGRMLDEWRELESVVPSLDHRVVLARTLTVDKVTLDASRWQTIAAIGGGRSVRELGDGLGLGELAVIRTVSDLVELGVVTVESPAQSRRPSVSARRSRSERPDRNERLERSGRSTTGERRRVPTPADNANGTGTHWRPGAGDRLGERPSERTGDAPGDRAEGRPAYGPRPAPGAATGRREDANGRSSTGGPAVPRRSRATGQRPGEDAGTDRTTDRSPMPRRRGSTTPPSPPASPPPPPAPSLPPSFGEGEPRRGPMLPPSLDTPPPGLPIDTGQVPVVPAPSLPADLSWAAEDGDPPLAPPTMPSPAVGTPPVTPAPRMMAPASDHRAPRGEPVAARGSMRGNTGMVTAQHYGTHREGDTAVHVAMMSPEARAAVEAAVGPTGGGAGFAVSHYQSSPDEARQRGALMGFLSSLRR
jgi:hypothetical protein